MPDKILRIRDVRRSLYDAREVVLELEAETPEGIRYIRTITLTEALKSNEYDTLELVEKLSQYQNGLKLRLQLCSNIIITLLGAK